MYPRRLSCLSHMPRYDFLKARFLPHEPEVVPVPSPTRGCDIGPDAILSARARSDAFTRPRALSVRPRRQDTRRRTRGHGPDFPACCPSTADRLGGGPAARPLDRASHQEDLMSTREFFIRTSKAERPAFVNVIRALPATSSITSRTSATARRATSPGSWLSSCARWGSCCTRARFTGTSRRPPARPAPRGPCCGAWTAPRRPSSRPPSETALTGRPLATQDRTLL